MVDGSLGPDWVQTVIIPIGNYLILVKMGSSGGSQKFNHDEFWGDSAVLGLIRCVLFDMMVVSASKGLFDGDLAWGGGVSGYFWGVPFSDFEVPRSRPKKFSEFFFFLRRL